jgi:hypothetical protein
MNTVDLALEVQPLDVRLLFADGRRTTARVFLHAASARRLGSQTLGERLNDHDLAFIPLELEGRVELVRLGTIAAVQCDLPLPEIEALDAVDAFREPVEIELAGGEWLRGDLRYELPPGGCRVSDLLNAPDQRFLLLQHERGVSYVHRDAIARVRS